MVVSFPVASAGVIAAFSFLIGGAAWRAMLRTGNGALIFVAAAFLLMGAKHVMKALLLLSSGVSVPWEVAFTLADVLVVALIAWPLLRGGGRWS